jgi:hypothetical protein
VVLGMLVLLELTEQEQLLVLVQEMRELRELLI